MEKSKKQHGRKFGPKIAQKLVIRDKAQFATKQRKFNGNKLVACFLKDLFIWYDTICTLNADSVFQHGTLKHSGANSNMVIARCAKHSSNRTMSIAQAQCL